MHVTQHLELRKKALVSLEITPPEKGHSIQVIYDAIDRLMPFSPSFINVTYHQQRIVFEEVNGLIVKVPKRKKPGTVGICAALANRYRMETVPHLICGGFSRYETEDALIDLQYLGFENLFVIRGDPPPDYKGFIPEPDGHQHAWQLVEQIDQLNRGQYLEKLDNAIPTDFCVGVAGYPEKHYEAPNLADDIRNLKIKVEKGASYILTQMVFSAEAYESFVRMARQEGIAVPIIPGIKVVVNQDQLVSIPRDFHVSLPEKLVDGIRGQSDRQAARQAGIDFTANLCRDLIDSGAPCLHFYTLGKTAATAEVMNNLHTGGLI